MIKQKLIVLAFILMMTNPGLSNAQTNPPQVLIIHSLNSEKAAIESMINVENSDSVISSILINQMDQTSLDNYDFVIFTSSVQFAIEGNEEVKLTNFANVKKNTLLVFTPFVDQFGGDLRDILGMVNINEILPKEDGEYTDWTLSLDQSLGDEEKDKTFDYSGKLGDVDLQLNTQVIVSAISSVSTGEDIMQANFPLPVIFNATTDRAEIITSTVSAIDGTSGFLNQIPDFFTILLQELFNVSFEIHKAEIISGTTDISDPNTSSQTDPQTSDTTNEDNNNVSLPLDISFQIEYFLLLLVLIGLIFIRKILSFLRWFGYKFLAAGVFVVGAFYNVQDRILDVNDVFLNQSRVQLLDYLDHLGQYGSHIRELKSVTSMGTGSLLWHLQVLEDFYLIQKYKVNRNTIFVSAEFIDKFDSEYKELEMNIQSKYSKTLLDELVKLEGEKEISVSRLEDLTNINNRTIRRFLNKLNQAEIIIYEQTSPIIFSFENFELLEKLHRGYELRSTYSFSRSDVDVQSF